MEIDSGSVPLNATNSDGSSPKKDPSWDVFSPFRLALVVYAAVALSLFGYACWPDYLAWLTK